MKNFIYLCFALGICMYSCKKTAMPDAQTNVPLATVNSFKLKENGIVANNDSALTITTYAGSGTAGSSNGTAGSPLTAQFASPEGIVFDTGGNMFIADRDNHVIRKISTTGMVSVFAGAVGVTGAANGAATVARFNSPIRLAIDAADNIYVADRDNARIRKITPAGVVSTIAGTTAGAGATQFNWPVDVAVKSDGSVIYVADSKNHRIQKITNTAGTYTTSLLAGNTGVIGHANGTGSAATFNFPAGVAIDNSGNVIVADRLNHCIRKITSAGAATLLAGRPDTAGYDVDAPALKATFGEPYGVTVANDGCIYVCDIAYHNIRRISNHGGFVACVAGYSASGYADGSFNTRFNVPTSIAIDNSGHFYVTDVSNNRIRKMSPETRSIQYTEGWTPMDTTSYPGIKRYKYTGNRFFTPSITANVGQNINIIDVDLSKAHFEFKQVDEANKNRLSAIVAAVPAAVAAISGTFATGNHVDKFASYLRENNVTYWQADAETSYYPDSYWHYHDAMFYVDASGTAGMEQSNMVQNPFSPTLRKQMMSGAPLLIKNNVPIEITAPVSWGTDPLVNPNPLRLIQAPRCAVALSIINNHVLLICVDGIERKLDGTHSGDCYTITRPARFGLTTADLTQFIQQYFHAPWAMNLDGGGSSSMQFAGAADGDSHGGTVMPIINYPDWDSACPSDVSRWGQQRIVMQDAICVIPN